MGRGRTYTREARKYQPFMAGVAGDTIANKVLEGPGIDIPANTATVGLGGDTILLYHANGSPVSEYPFTAGGFSSALAAAISGDVISLPAGSLSLPGGGADRLVDTFSIDASVNAYQSGTFITDTGSSYRLDVTGNVQWSMPGQPNYKADPQYVTENNWSSYSKENKIKFSDGSLPSADDVTYSATHKYSFTRSGTGTAFSLLFYDGYYPDNVGTLSVDVYEIAAGNVVIPNGVEVIGLGKNSILVGSIVNNGIVTNLRATGSIGGTGVVRLVDNPTNIVFNQKISMSEQKILNLGLPENPHDAANKEYVDGNASGLGWSDAIAFGATGDGVADDTTALASLFADALTSGKVSYIRPGRYKVTSDLTFGSVSASGLRLICDGTLVLGTNAGANHKTVSIVGNSHQVDINCIEGGTLSVDGYRNFVECLRIDGLDQTTDGMRVNKNSTIARIGRIANVLHGLQLLNSLGGVFSIGVIENCHWGITLEPSNNSCGENRITWGVVGECSVAGIAFNTNGYSKEGNIFTGAIFTCPKGIDIPAGGTSNSNIFNVVVDNNGAGGTWDILDAVGHNIYNLYWSVPARTSLGPFSQAVIQNVNPGVAMTVPANIFGGYAEFWEITAPGTPAANQIRVYAKDKSGVSALFMKNDAGTETEIGSGAGHDPVTVSDTTTLDLTLSGQALSGVVLPAGIKLDDLGTPDDNTDLNASLTAHGLLPKLGGGSTNFLRADGTWSAPPAGGGAVATDTIWDAKGDLAVGTGADTAAKLTVGANGTYLKADSTQATGLKWDTPAGAGDVVGPASATDGHLAVFDGTTGKLVKDGGAPSGGSGIPLSGWIDADAMTYASADSPTFTMTCSGDQTGKYQVGQRVKLTQTTVKYFIITAVSYSAPNTTITLYGGTDYTLANAAITSPAYSPVKAPYGFPLDPSKWTVIVTDTTQRSQANPTAGTWYNLGSVMISIPIGCWRVNYEITAQSNRSGNGTADIKTTLSTANNSESDTQLSCLAANYSITVVEATFFREKTMTLASKTSYYLNTKASNVDSGTTIYNRGDDVATVIRAVCAYL